MVSCVATLLNNTRNLVVDWWVLFDNQEVLVTFRKVRSLMFVFVVGAAACAVTVRAPSGVVYIHRAPPPIRVEVRGARPSAQHVWVAGHWVGRGEEFVWEPGRWVLLESGHRAWVEGAWRHDRNGWFWVEGHWR